jgi:hypothetical protein
VVPGAAVVAFDPGRHVGVAWLDAEGRLLRGDVLDLPTVARLELPPDVQVVVGNGTGSRAVQAALVAAGHAFVTVDERGSTEEGRRLYLRDHPPRGLARWLPAGMRAPPRSVDDYAAYAIGLRWLAAHRSDCVS